MDQALAQANNFILIIFIYYEVALSAHGQQLQVYSVSAVVDPSPFPENLTVLSRILSSISAFL